MQLNYKHKALIANIIYPGAGYWLLKKWIRALIAIIATLATTIWLLVIFANMIIGAYYQIQNNQDFSYNYIYFLFPFLTFFILWTITYIDIIFYCSHPLSCKNHKKSDGAKNV